MDNVRNLSSNVVAFAEPVASQPKTAATNFQSKQTLWPVASPIGVTEESKKAPVKTAKPRLDIFLKFGDIKGEETESRHKDWMF